MLTREGETILIRRFPLSSLPTKLVMPNMLAVGHAKSSCVACRWRWIRLMAIRTAILPSTLWFHLVNSKTRHDRKERLDSLCHSDARMIESFTVWGFEDLSLWHLRLFWGSSRTRSQFLSGLEQSCFICKVNPKYIPVVLSGERKICISYKKQLGFLNPFSCGNYAACPFPSVKLTFSQNCSDSGCM